MITLPRFPFPPSANEIYSNGKRGRFKSRIYAQYVKACEEWRQCHLQLLFEARKSLAKENYLHASYVFYVEKDRIICRSERMAGKPKKFDVSNRIKACEDQVFGMLLKDDSCVFSFDASKVASDENYVDIFIGPKGHS